MRKKNFIVTTLAVAVLLGIFSLGYRFFRVQNSPSRAELLLLMPGDANAIFYVDLSNLRQAPLVTQLIAWAPKPQADADYAQFVRDTDFDYERDLDRIAIASYRKSQRTTLLAVASGRFDRKKLMTYAQLHGRTFAIAGSNPVFAIPMSDSSAILYFAFFRDDEIAITDDESGPDKLREITRPGNRRTDWQPRFERVSGSPIFAVLQQDAATGDALAAQAPGGLRSPQLSALLNQLQWITIAGIPTGATLRVVTECESASAATARQLADMLNGVIILAQAGLNDPKTRRQLAPDLRQAYLELLNGAEISQLDRNQTKSVRILFDVTPKFLDAAKSVPPQQSTPAVRTPPPGKRPTRN